MVMPQVTHETTHMIEMWTCFYLGVISYWLKRAYYGINPPNPVATGYVNWVQRSWAPLCVRALLESLIFWIMFTPGLADKALAYVGWTEYSWLVFAVTEVPPIAILFGHSIDSIADLLVSKVPFINSILPQMPGSLPQQAPADSAVTNPEHGAK